jgi:hypothetical protein
VALVLVVVGAVDDPELAALAIAAPPPATAAVRARVVMIGLILDIVHLLSAVANHDAAGSADSRRSNLRKGDEER